MTQRGWREREDSKRIVLFGHNVLVAFFGRLLKRLHQMLQHDVLLAQLFLGLDLVMILMLKYLRYMYIYIERERL